MLAKCRKHVKYVCLLLSAVFLSGIETTKPTVFVIVFVESACLRARRITCAFPVRSVSFVPHGNEKYVVTNTLFVQCTCLANASERERVNELLCGCVYIFLFSIHYFLSTNRRTTLMYLAKLTQTNYNRRLYTYTHVKNLPKAENGVSVWACACTPDMLRYVVSVFRLVVANWTHVFCARIIIFPYNTIRCDHICRFWCSVCARNLHHTSLYNHNDTAQRKEDSANDRELWKSNTTTQFIYNGTQMDEFGSQNEETDVQVVLPSAFRLRSSSSTASIIREPFSPLIRLMANLISVSTLNERQNFSNENGSYGRTHMTSTN